MTRGTLKAGAQGALSFYPGLGTPSLGAPRPPVCGSPPQPRAEAVWREAGQPPTAPGPRHGAAKQVKPKLKTWEQNTIVLLTH